MKKLTLVGYGKDKAKVLKNLQKTGCVEIQRSALLDNTFTKEDGDKKDGVQSSLLRLQFAFDFLKGEQRAAENIYKAEKKAEKKEKKSQTAIAAEDKFAYTPEKKKLFHPVPRFDFEEFYEITAQEEEIFSKVAELERINQRYVDIRAEITKLQAMVSQLEVFRSITVKMSAFRDTAHAAVILGAVPEGKLHIIGQIKSDFPMLYAETGEGERLIPVVVIALKTEIDKITERLNEADFIKAGYNFDMTADEKLAEIGARIGELSKEKKALLEKTADLQSVMPKLRQLYDYYVIENARLAASDGFALTKTSYILEGWFPADEEEKVRAALNDASDALVIDTREPVEGDFVPTLTVNNKIVAPYECITNMYSVPSYRDVDPNPFVAFFYFLMFGLMMGDAVYGLILLTLGLLAYKFMKPVPGKGKLVLVIAMGGLSTFIWGILFGGWMAFDVGGTFLEKLIWFKPIDETNPNTAIYMLILSLGIGVFQILFGMGIHAYDLIKRKKVLGAVSEVFSWYSVFLGIGLLAISIFKKIEALKYAGIAFACLGVLLILVLGGRGRKGFGRFTGGFSQLYGGVNFLSDILSYSRLFGLGLATAVIGMVINQICGVIVSLLPAFGGVPVLGVIVAAPIFLVGHTFNIGINTLGTYVHNSRLQFIEFFSRFYEGGGHAFKPLGSNTKYTYIKK